MSLHLLDAEPPLAARLRPAYAARIAQRPADIAAAQALRFAVFNLELDEGLPESYGTGLDVDPFDAVCDHLIVEDTLSGTVVGTYRMQSGARALSALGYYSEQEFDFSPFERSRGEILELGRACVHKRHRNFAVLNLLWKGIAAYAQERGTRYLMGCSSLTSQDASVGAAAYRRLLPNLAPQGWRTLPHRRWACAMDEGPAKRAEIPRLLSAYLALGAAICGPPAIDRTFGTIDFLTWLDIESPDMMAMRWRGRFLA
ncbi:MAG: GNAT family N-acyltransferase [Burkholderiaceae bacterium]